jgi:hypothetical protein
MIIIIPASDIAEASHTVTSFLNLIFQRPASLEAQQFMQMLCRRRTFKAETIPQNRQVVSVPLSVPSPYYSEKKSNPSILFQNIGYPPNLLICNSVISFPPEKLDVH